MSGHISAPTHWFYSSFLLSVPGVVTITFSGVMMSAPLAVAAPLKQ